MLLSLRLSPSLYGLTFFFFVPDISPGFISTCSLSAAVTAPYPRAGEQLPWQGSHGCFASPGCWGGRCRPLPSPGRGVQPTLRCSARGAEAAPLLPACGTGIGGWLCKARLGKDPHKASFFFPSLSLQF